MGVWIIVTSVVVAFTVWQLHGRKPSSAIQLPQQDYLPPEPFPIHWRLLSWVFHVATLFFLGLTFIHFLVGDGPFERFLGGKLVAIPIPPKSSRLVFFVLDRSGSMSEPYPMDPAISKITMVKDGVVQYIRQQDRRGGEFDFYGLISFARAAQIMAPLTRTHTYIEEEIQSLIPETLDRLNGTAIGYAIFKTAYLLVACQQFAKEDLTDKSVPFLGQAMVVITDGIAEPNPADRGDPFRSMRTLSALRIAKDNGIRVHYINIDKNSYERLSLDERDQLRGAVEATGGIYGVVSVAQGFQSIMDQIAAIESPQQVAAFRQNAMTIGFWLIVCSLISFSGSRLLESFVLRAVR